MAAGVDPRMCFRDVLRRIGHKTDAAKLTPHAWREHLAATKPTEKAVHLRPGKVTMERAVLERQLKTIQAGAELALAKVALQQ